MIIKAGMKVQCSQGHVCGEVTSDLDTDQRIVVRGGDPLRWNWTSGAPVSLDRRNGVVRPVMKWLLE
jgi:hypothetical protein